MFNFSVTGAQLLGFVTLLCTIGPTLVMMGRLIERVKQVEVRTAEDREAAEKHRIQDSVDRAKLYERLGTLERQVGQIHGIISTHVAVEDAR